MSQPNVTVYGVPSCPETTRATQFLNSRGVPFEFHDVDHEPGLNDFIAGLNGGKRVMPTIRINNKNLFNPSDQELGDTVAQAARA